MDKLTIASQFRSEMVEKRPLLEELREISRLMDPTILPPEDTKPSDALPHNYQSEGARLGSGLTGQILSAAFPVGAPFARTEIAPEVKHDESLTAEQVEEIEGKIFVRDVITLATIEGSNGTGGNDSVLGFHAKARNVIEQVVQLGDCLVRMDPDFGLTTFRPDDYTVIRSSRGEVLAMTAREGIDLASLDFGVYEKRNVIKAVGAKTESKFDKLHLNERAGILYTRIEYQPITAKWNIRQEVATKGSSAESVQIYETDEAVCPYWTVFWKLSSKQHYGTGLGYLNRGDMKMYDFLSQQSGAFAENASKIHWIVEETATNFDTKRLAMPTGTISRGKVTNGKAVDIACLSSEKQGDFGIVRAHMQDLRAQLGRAFLDGQGSTRDSERTTKFEVEKVALASLQNALGGVYPNIADGFQVPLWRRAVAQLEAQKKMAPLPAGSVKTVSLTGLAALSGQVQFNSVRAFAQFIAELGEQPSQAMHIDKYLAVAARYLGISEPGLIKTSKERQADINQALQTQARQQAITTGIQTAGKIAETQAAAGGI